MHEVKYFFRFQLFIKAKIVLSFLCTKVVDEECIKLGRFYHFFFKLNFGCFYPEFSGEKKLRLHEHRKVRNCVPASTSGQ